jgi:Holliday junction DNA helicase RuvB
VRDFAAVSGVKRIDRHVADGALLRLDIDESGLDAVDRRYLRCIAENYSGGPVGAETLAAALSEERDVIEEVIEPYLLQEGLLQRSSRGRLLTERGYRHIGLVPLRPPSAQLDLLADGDAEAS